MSFVHVQDALIVIRLRAGRISRFSEVSISGHKHRSSYITVSPRKRLNKAVFLCLEDTTRLSVVFLGDSSPLEAGEISPDHVALGSYL